MKQLIERWRDFASDVRLDEAMAGLSKKERDRVKSRRKSSEAARRSMGMPDEYMAGERDLSQLSKGIYETEEIEEGGNPWHGPDGRLSGPQKNNIYSISNAGAARLGIDKSHAKKGRSTGNKGKDGKTKLAYRYTMASGPKACGRVDVQKGAIPYRKICKSYPDDVREEMEDASCPVDGVVSSSYVRGVVSAELDKAVKEIANIVVRTKRGGGTVTMDQMVPAIRRLALSLKGKTPEEQGSRRKM